MERLLSTDAYDLTIPQSRIRSTAHLCTRGPTVRVAIRKADINFYLQICDNFCIAILIL